jgi:hypothetical protein
MQIISSSVSSLCVAIGSALLVVAASSAAAAPQMQSAGGAISVSPVVPSELNPPFTEGKTPSGGAPDASPEQAAAFAWQEFIALNWPAGSQQGLPGQRDTASPTNKFGDPGYAGPLVWETLRGKVEIFPGNVNPFKVVAPPGYPGPSGDKSFGYDALPVYNYSTPIPACNSSQSNDATPWINLDETDQITLDNMYAGVVSAGVSPGNSSPQLVRFLAKANRSEYVYVTSNSSPGGKPPVDPSALWWASIPKQVVDDTKAYLQANQASPPAGSTTLVSQLNGTIEAKAGWRPLNPTEAASGRFHVQTVRFYESASGGSTKCYVDAKWGLVALHIIQKTPSAPYFIYATFEQADNILTADGKPVEDADGKVIQPVPPTVTSPKVCLIDPKPPMGPPPPNGQEMTSMLGSVIASSDTAKCTPAPTTRYCDKPGSRLFYRNVPGSGTNTEPSGGHVCVDKRENPIPDYAIQANAQAHAAIAAWLRQSGITSSPWLAYKLINVQYYPYDKIPDPSIPNGSPYTSKPPFTAKNPAASSFYQANIVVETNRSLQQFSGGLSPSITTDWNQDGTPHKNSYYGGHFFNMGGCMGCHGSQGQNPLVPYGAGDFSVILARGTVSQPEAPSVETTRGMTSVQRNRSLSR